MDNPFGDDDTDRAAAGDQARRPLFHAAMRTATAMSGSGGSAS
jgi:hypothetical protein